MYVNSLCSFRYKYLLHLYRNEWFAESNVIGLSLGLGKNVVFFVMFTTFEIELLLRNYLKYFESLKIYSKLFGTIRHKLQFGF